MTLSRKPLKDFRIVDSQAGLKEIDQKLMSGDTPKFDLLAYDCETNGLLFYRNVIIGVSISYEFGQGWYIPFLNWVPDPESKKIKKVPKTLRVREDETEEVFTGGKFRCVWTGKEYPEEVTPDQYRPPKFIVKYLNRWLKSTKLIMHNAPFDIKMAFYHLDLDLTDQLFCDTRLLKHFIDESTETGLKETALLWANDLGFDVAEEANVEQRLVKRSVWKHGGKSGHLWRADPKLAGTYAAADTSLTFGIFEVGMQKLESDYGERGIKLFFETEVMPVCREVVIPMHLGGMRVNVTHFEQIKAEILELLTRYEDSFMAKTQDLLKDFAIGKSVDQAATKKKLVEKILAQENLPYPAIKSKKTGVVKKSLSRGAVEKAAEFQPHWVWDYLLGKGEIKYSEGKLKALKNEIYQEGSGRRYPFNLNSDMHLRWLLFAKLKNDPSSVPQTDSATLENPIPSCSADVLEEHFKDKYPFIEDVMLYRKFGDLLSNYVEKALTLHNKGWLHMEMDQAGTTSGRFSCRGGFNLQTLPKVEELGNCPKCESKKIEIKREGRLLAHIHCQNCGHVKANVICYSVVKQGFVAPEGMKIVNADYESLEPKIFAEVANDPGLKAIYFQLLDMYSKVYCDVEEAHDKYSPDPKASNFLKKVNPALRSGVKPVVLGIPYGARGPQVANLMGFKKKIKDKATGKEIEVLDVKRGHEWREKYLNAYPKLREYMERSELDACIKGFVETRMGRRRHFKYAPIVYKILSTLRIDKEAFLDAKRKDLEGTEVCVDGRALKLKHLEWFSKKSGIYLSNILKKDGWAYIRGLFKNELDNAKNFQIQGLAAHVCNLGMLYTTRLFKKHGLEGYVALQVHDEICCYVDEKRADLGSKLLQKGMERNRFAKMIEVGMKAEPLICETLKESK